MRSCLLILTLLFFALPVLADTYSWVDDQGTVNFTENPGSIPKKYRKKARLIGDEEPAPSQVNEEKEKPAAIRQPADVTREKPSATAKMDQKMYGGKDAQTWKSEFEGADADLKAAEKQLVEYRNQLQDTSRMSRSQYLNIQSTIKMLESSVLGQRKKLEEMKQDAERAGVPPQLME